MTTANSKQSQANPHWPPSFKQGASAAVALVFAFTVWVLVSATTFTWLFGDEYSFLLRSLWSIPSGIVQFGIIAAVYRYDGVTLREIGLSTGLLRPAALATLGVIIAINGIVFGLGILAGNDVTVGAYALYQSPPFTLSWPAIAATAFSSYVFIGPAEELAFRGYLQNKLISLFDSGTVRARTAASIVATGGIFSALHVPVKILVDGTAVSQLLGPLVLVALSGMLFGAIYALTQNLYLVIFLHGAGDFWPLVVNPGRGIWPNYLVVLLVYLGLILCYRVAATRTALPTPSLTPTD